MILFSAVRSNLESNTGFLRDPQRMNVMLTRAKRGLVVFGDRETMSTEKEIWKRWFKWIDSKKAALTLERLDELLPIVSSAKSQTITNFVSLNRRFFGSIHEDPSDQPHENDEPSTGRGRKRKAGVDGESPREYYRAGHRTGRKRPKHHNRAGKRKAKEQKG